MYWRNTSRKLTGEDAATIAERILSGESSVKVAADFGITREYAKRLANGIDRKAETAEVRARFKGEAK